MIGGLKQRIGAALVSAGNVLARRPVPPQGRLLKYQSSDYRRDSVSDGLTPKKARSVLLAADGGDLSEAMRLFSEMEDKDARLQSVLSTRRLTLTGMDWEVVSAAELEKGIVDKVLADESAAFCRDRLSGLHDFDQALTDLALAIGPGLAALALVWNGNKLVAIDPVPEMRPFIDFNRDNRVRIARTQGDREGFLGVPPNFVVHMPHARHGLPMRGSLMRSIVLIYLIRNYAIKDWAVFSEVFGMPVRIGRYDPSATPEEKTEMLEMLQTLGTDAVGIFSKSMDLEFKEAGDRRGAPFEGMINWAAREIAVAVLGQNMTTDNTGATGSLAAAEVQDRVREDLLEADMKAESLTVRNQILAPMVRYGFTLTADAPVPHFRRKSREVIDRILEGNVLDTAINRLGLHVPKSYAYEQLGIALPPGVKGTDFVEKQESAAPFPPSPFGGAV